MVNSPGAAGAQGRAKGRCHAIGNEEMPVTFLQKPRGDECGGGVLGGQENAGQGG